MRVLFVNGMAVLEVPWIESVAVLECFRPVRFIAFPLFPKMKTNPFPSLLLVLALTLFASCGKESEPTAKPKKVPLPLAREVKVETRADTLAYLPGASTPFTGDAIDIYAEEQPATVKRRIPYLEGRKHGKVTTYTPKGRVREERAYDDGRPVSSDVFHSNGQRKIAVLLNEKDLAEGPYRRWYDNGVLESECTFDSEERFHGIEKDYDREGKLVAEYRKEHGKLVEIIFETPEMKAIRIQKETPPPAPAKP